MKPKLVFFIILFIAGIGLGLRLYKISEIPPFLSNDEISIAYDAYSIARTGKDEHNHPWPISFESHGTYKAPLYAYLLAPITLLGPNTDLVAKIPSVIAGTLTIIFVGLLTIELTGRDKLGVISALIVATTPWHIYTSRMVLEANVALLFLIIGIWLFIKAINNPKKGEIKIVSAAIFLVLGMYGYHTEWGLVPILFILFTYFYLNSCKKKLAVLFICIGIVLSLPLLGDYFLHLGTGARASSEMLWRESRLENILKEHVFWGTKILIIGKVFISNYLSYLNPGYLFFTGLNLFPGEHPYQIGLFLTPLLLAIVIGLLFMNKYIQPKHRRFFGCWLLISPIVPALTHGGNNMVRNLVSLVPYVIIIAIGFWCIWQKSKLLILVLISLSVTVFLFNSLIYIHHFPEEMAESFQGYKPVAQYLAPVFTNGTVVKVDFRYGLMNEFVGVPHLYFAFYEHWDPAILQNRRITNEGVWYKNLLVTQIDWSNEKIVPKTIYVVPSANPPLPTMKSKLKLLQEFTDMSGRGSFEVWQGI